MAWLLEKDFTKHFFFLGVFFPPVTCFGLVVHQVPMSCVGLYLCRVRYSPWKTES